MFIRYMEDFTEIKLRKKYNAARAEKQLVGHTESDRLDLHDFIFKILIRY